MEGVWDVRGRKFSEKMWSEATDRSGVVAIGEGGVMREERGHSPFQVLRFTSYLILNDFLLKVCYSP